MRFKKSAKGIRYVLDDEILKMSSSGGAFVAFANYILNIGGCVYGAAFDENNVVRHIRIDEKKDIIRIQGSKYVQSKVDNCFSSVKKDLINGTIVLFTGTPCQIAGLKSFLKVDGEVDDRKLFTMDFTCHGVPSPLFFRVYLKWLESKYNIQIKCGDYIFRVKKHGWYYRRQMSYTMKVASHYRYVGSDPYYYNFLNAVDYRETCYLCPFKQENHFADITVGDFGGVDIAYPDFFDRRGISYAIINTEIGLELINSIEMSVDSINVDYATLIKHNKTILTPVKRPPKRDTFYLGINNSDYVEKMNQEIPLKSRIKPFIPYFLEKAIKKFICIG